MYGDEEATQLDPQRILKHEIKKGMAFADDEATQLDPQRILKPEPETIELREPEEATQLDPQRILKLYDDGDLYNEVIGSNTTRSAKDSETREKAPDLQTSGQKQHNSIRKGF